MQHTHKNTKVKYQNMLTEARHKFSNRKRSNFLSLISKIHKEFITFDVKSVIFFNKMDRMHSSTSHELSLANTI